MAALEPGFEQALRALFYTTRRHAAQSLDPVLCPRDRLAGLAIGDDHCRMLEASGIERACEARQLCDRHFAVGDDAEAPAGEHRLEAIAGAFEQVVADDDVVGALTERDVDDGRVSHCRLPN